jgi:hypothetical protein
MSLFNQERRKHLRISKHFIITYHEAAVPDARHSVSQLKDISQGGVCFSSCVGYNEGTVLDVFIKTPYLAETLNTRGTVVACAEKISNVIYEIHVQLNDLNAETEQILKKIEKSFLDSQKN